MPLSGKKFSTKDVKKGTDKLADMLLTEKKYSRKNIEKDTDELSDMKQVVSTIRRKVLDQFEVQSSASKGWFKLDIGF